MMRALEEDLIQIANELKNLQFEQKTFFITGATGLVGSILVKAILAANRMFDWDNRVIAMVRNREKADRIFGQCHENDRLEYYIGDVTAPVVCDQDIDYIIHAASETKSLNMVQYPVETLWTTVCGSKNVLDFAVEKQVKGMVYLSSMEAFGQTDSSLNYVMEKDLGFIDLENVRSCYPESKRLVENMCTCYAKEYNVPVVVARLAQTFGAGVDPLEGRVFAQFAKSAITGQDIVLHTRGNSYGNYVYTADAAKAIFLLLKKGKYGEAYTVVNEETVMRIRDMAEMVAHEVAQETIKVVFDIPEKNKYGYAPDVVMKLDASKLRDLGWAPEKGLLEAYQRMISDWKSVKS